MKKMSDRQTTLGPTRFKHISAKIREKTLMIKMVLIRGFHLENYLFYLLKIRSNGQDCVVIVRVWVRIIFAVSHERLV